MGHQTSLLLKNFLVATYASIKSYLKLIETDHKYYSEHMWKPLHFGLVYMILVSSRNMDILDIPSV